MVSHYTTRMLRNSATPACLTPLFPLAPGWQVPAASMWAESRVSFVYPLSPASLFRRHASQVESRLHQGECPPDPSRRRALTTPPFADGHDPGGLQARSSGVDCPSRGRYLFQVLGTVRGARAPLGCWSRRCPSAYALICAHGCRCSMISSRCFTLSSPRARG